MSPSTGTSGKSTLSNDEIQSISRVQYTAFRKWLQLERVLGTNSTSARASARQKLTRLSTQQFQELSTDVYDELLRRFNIETGQSNDDSQPFLSVKNEFHPKRNQARQKLATLPVSRFRDLTSDIYYELDRRYPQFDVEYNSFSGVPSIPKEFGAGATGATGATGTTSAMVHGRSGSSGAAAAEAKQLDAGKAKSSYNQSNNYSQSNQAIYNQSGPGSYGQSGSSHTRGGSTNGFDKPAPYAKEYGYEAAPPVHEVVVPNKSTLVMEGDEGGGQEVLSSAQGAQSAPADAARSPVPDYSSTRASEASSLGTRFLGNYATSEVSRGVDGGANESDARRALEQELATLRAQHAAAIARATSAEAETASLREAHARRVQRLEDAAGEERARAVELAAGGDIARITQERDEHAALSHELRTEVTSLVEELRSMNARYEEAVRGREEAERQRDLLADDVRVWQKKYERTKSELRSIKATSQLYVSSIGVTSGSALPTSASGIVWDAHLGAFQTAIDGLLLAARGADPAASLTAMKDVVSAVDAIDRTVGAADVPSAVAADAHSLRQTMSATLTNLVAASRTHAESFGVSPVSLVDAAASHLATAVIDLARLLKIKKTSPAERSLASAPPVPDLGEFQQGMAAQTSSQGAAQTSSQGAAPAVGPGHTSQNSQSQPPANHSRQASEFTNASRQSDYASNGYASNTSSYAPNEYGTRASTRTSPHYASGAASQRSASGYSQTASNGYGRTGHQRNASGANSYSSVASPRTADFDKTNVASPRAEEPGESLVQLRTYVEYQTEQIVNSIQALLGAIRSGADGERLNHNLTEIITIVASIVAIASSSMPAHLVPYTDGVLRSLTENCDKLSEIQASPAGGSTVYSKPSKQNMASASFSVAKALKELNSQLAPRDDEA